MKIVLIVEISEGCLSEVYLKKKQTKKKNKQHRNYYWSFDLTSPQKIMRVSKTD